MGDNVTLYQGVTLGGTGKEQGKRHPTLGDNVMVSAGAKILGSFTIGDNCKVGAGSCGTAAGAAQLYGRRCSWAHRKERQCENTPSNGSWIRWIFRTRYCDAISELREENNNIVAKN